MRKHVAWYAGVVVLTVVVITVLVIRALGGDGTGDASTSSTPDDGAITATAPAGGAAKDDASSVPSGSRPNCPHVDLGVPLDCLGAATTGHAKGTVVVNVWAWWCQPCRKELPVMNEFAKKHPDISVVGVHANPDASKAVEVLDNLGISYPSFQDGGNEFAATQGLPNVVPVTLVLHSDAPPQLYAQVFHSVDELESTIL